MELEERAADPLAGGLQQGYQCGMLWGAALAAGAQAYRIWGATPQAQAKAMIASQKIVESFRTQNKNINCLEITEIDLSSPTMRMVARYLIKSSAKGSCFGMAARSASAALREINATFSDNHFQAPIAPVSCATMLAQKMGASELHTVMATGFAGGIGLSGGGCGVLGAAIWLHGMKLLEKGGTIGYNAPYASDITDKFLESSDYEFECAKIVGRQFEYVDDHADHLHKGGCSKIIEALTTA